MEPSKDREGNLAEIRRLVSFLDRRAHRHDGEEGYEEVTEEEEDA